tara:strand:- start:9109 stop:9315 length:207 start_codon:yes stop_codon:yes gene_type:complete
MSRKKKRKTPGASDMIEVAIGCLAWVLAIIAFLLAHFVFVVSALNAFWIAIAVLIVVKVIEELISRRN